MQVIHLKTFGGTDGFEWQPEASAPVPGKGEVLVRVAATSINPIDCLRRQGYGKWFARRRGLPLVLGCDLAGTVEALGLGAGNFALGDRVWGCTGPAGPGTYAELVAVKERLLSPLPAGVDFAGAAAIAYAGLTAWAALVRRVGVKPGELADKRVLVHGGAGGVGSVAIQLLRAWGAEVAATCSAANLELVRSLGASTVVDYRSTDFTEVLSELDIVLDCVGNAGGEDTEARCLSVLRQASTAQYVTIVHPLVSLLDERGPVLGSLKAVRTFCARRWVARPRAYHWAICRPDAAALAQVGEQVTAGKIRPIIERRMGLAEIPAAHRLLEAGGVRGKLVIEVPVVGGVG